MPVLRRKVEAPRNAFELPGGVLIPAHALLVCLAILASAAWADLQASGAGAGALDILALPMVGGTLALVVGAVLYAVARKRA